MGFSGIYFIWNGRRVKIGMSICIRSRMTTMQIENDETLKLIGFIPSPDYNFMGWLENKYTKWDDEYFKKYAIESFQMRNKNTKNILKNINLKKKLRNINGLI